MRAAWLAAALVVTSIPSPGAFAPAKVYRITGVAMSTRDGSPIPYCRLTANAVVERPEGRNFGRGPGPGGNGNPGVDFMADSGERFFGQPGPGGPGARRGNSPEPEIAATADAQGHFSLTLPHGGAWRLNGVARGYRSQSFDQHDGGFYAQIVLSDAAPVYTLDFRMARNASLSGAVYDDAGDPVRQARVSAELLSPKLPGEIRGQIRILGNVSTDDRGYYEMSNLEPGAYRLKLTAQPWYAAGANRAGVRVAGATATSGNDLGRIARSVARSRLCDHMVSRHG